MGALDGLHLAGGIPPGVEQEDMVSHLQVQALAARLQGDEDYPEGRVGVEGGERVIAGLHRHATPEDDARDALALQSKLDELEHSAELREDDGLVCWVGAY